MQAEHKLTDRTKYLLMWPVVGFVALATFFAGVIVTNAFDSPTLASGPPAARAGKPLAFGPSGLRGGLEDFDLSAVTWNSYWYSRYNLGSLVMMSGLGVPFEPLMKDVLRMARMVDQGSAEGEHVVLPKNAALLQAVYAGGSSALATQFKGDPGDFANGRWDLAKADRRITTSAQAQTIIKETEWSKLFNNGSWSGKVTDDFGAMDRFKGVAMFAEAKMQLAFAHREMRNEQGLYVAAIEERGEGFEVTDPRVRLEDQYQMLQAFADVQGVLQHPERFNDVYGDETFNRFATQAADDLFDAISNRKGKTIHELALGAQALTWYASSTPDPNLRGNALALLAETSEALVRRDPTDVVDAARAVRGLIEGGRVLGDDRYLDGATGIFEQMLDEYDFGGGYFRSRKRLTNWEVGDILGALNALLREGSPALDADQVERVLVGFFESAVNRSGLMQAAPPKEAEASPFEIETVSKDLFFVYPGIPTPDQAGGRYGRAPVDAAEIRFDDAQDRWVVTDRTFDTAGAMHASNEQVWIFGFVDAFPEVDEK